MWEQLGLLKVPELAEPSPLEDSFACLRHLLGYALQGGVTVRDAIEVAMDGLDTYTALLQSNGIRVRENPIGFFVAASHPQVQDIFLDTEWATGRWRYALRGLPGVKGLPDKVQQMRFGSTIYHGVFVPERYLDDRFPRRAA